MRKHTCVHTHVYTHAYTHMRTQSDRSIHSQSFPLTVIVGVVQCLSGRVMTVYIHHYCFTFFQHAALRTTQFSSITVNSHFEKKEEEETWCLLATASSKYNRWWIVLVQTAICPCKRWKKERVLMVIGAVRSAGSAGSHSEAEKCGCSCDHFLMLLSRDNEAIILLTAEDALKQKVVSSYYMPCLSEINMSACM